LGARNWGQEIRIKELGARNVSKILNTPRDVEYLEQ